MITVFQVITGCDGNSARMLVHNGFSGVFQQQLQWLETILQGFLMEIFSLFFLCQHVSDICGCVEICDQSLNGLPWNLVCLMLCISCCSQSCPTFGLDKGFFWVKLATEASTCAIAVSFVILCLFSCFTWWCKRMGINQKPLARLNRQCLEVF